MFDEWHYADGCRLVCFTTATTSSHSSSSPGGPMHKPAIILSLLLMAGCTRTNAALLDQTTSYPKTCERGILMYTQPSKAPAAYKELALLNATGSSSWTSEGGMMKSMRKKAADLGATGIIL